MIFVVKEGRSKTHYCHNCGLAFISTAHEKLTLLESTIRENQA